MKKIVFICPYFGKLPYNQMKLFLKSCNYNKNYDFIVITNDKSFFEKPDNVKFIYYNFDEMIKLIQSKFEFKIKDIKQEDSFNFVLDTTKLGNSSNVQEISNTTLLTSKPPTC